jgi:hypothetical protein
MMLVIKILGHRFYLKRMMSNTSNVALCLHNCGKKTQDDPNVDEPLFIDSNKTVLNVKPVSRSVGVGDAVVDAEFILDVDPQPTATRFTLDIDLPSIESEFMPEYETTFRDERAEDSADDRPIPELSNRDKALLQ